MGRRHRPYAVTHFEGRPAVTFDPGTIYRYAPRYETHAEAAAQVAAEVALREATERTVAELERRLETACLFPEEAR